MQTLFDNKKSLRTFASLILGLIGLIPSLQAARIDPVGSPLRDEIKEVFIPPTRAEDPFVATADGVFQWSSETKEWMALYSPPWNGSSINSISGYGKSSQVLYVSHTNGIARTGDGGKTWIESIPPAYQESSISHLSLSVNPIDRKHAMACADGSAWESTNFGASWTPLEIDHNKGRIVASGFLPSGDEGTRFLIAQEQGLTLYAGSPLVLKGKWRTQQPLAAVLLHPVQQLVFLQDTDGHFQLLSLPLDGAAKVRPLPLSSSPKFAIPASAGSSSLWTLSNNSLQLVSVFDPALSLMAIPELPDQTSELLNHPEVQDSLIFFAANQLYLAQGLFEGGSASLIQPADLNGAVPIVWEQADSIAELREAKDEPMEVAILLNKILSGEPSFNEALRKALEHEQVKPGSYLEWQLKARKRHWLPELRLEAGVREYPADNNTIITGFDRFGIETTEDFRLPDRIRNMTYMGVVLQWQLDELAYDDEILDISRERRNMFKDRRELIDDLSNLYYTRIQKIIEVKGFSGKQAATNQMSLLLEIHQLSEVLNGYCGEDLFNPSPVQ